MIILGYLRLSPVSKVWLGELFELLARNLDNGDDVVVDVDDDDNVENGKDDVTCHEARPPAGWLQSHLPRLNRSTLVMKMMLMMIVATILLTTLLNVDHDENTEPGPGPWLPPLPPDAPSLQVHDHHQHDCCHHYKHQHCHHRQQHHWLQHLGLECGAGLLPRDFILLEKRSESKIEKCHLFGVHPTESLYTWILLIFGWIDEKWIIVVYVLCYNRGQKVKVQHQFYRKGSKMEIEILLCWKSSLSPRGRKGSVSTNKRKERWEVEEKQKTKIFSIEIKKTFVLKRKKVVLERNILLKG